MTRSVVMSYGDAEREYNKRRQAETRRIGRYIITKEGDDYVFSDNERANIKYGRLSPDNVFTFTLNLFAVNNTGFGGSNLYNALPFVIHRLGSGKYGVTHRYTELKRYIRIKDSIIYHKGIKFCMATGKCLNPKRPYKERMNKEVNRQWLRDRKEFLAKVAVLERLGAYERDVQELNYIDIADYMDKFVDAIKHKKADIQTLEDLYSAELTCMYRYPSIVPMLETKSIYHTIKDLIATNSLALRQAYGVFDDEWGTHHETTWLV